MNEAYKKRARAWFEELRDRICATFELIEDDLTGSFAARPAGRFEQKTWERPSETPDGGGGGVGGGGCGVRCGRAGRVWLRG